MTKYRKKPMNVKAFQMTKDRRSDNSDWPGWLNLAWQMSVVELGSVFSSADGCLKGEPHPLFIHTLVGIVKVEWGDWIIMEAPGNLYLCDHETFIDTHDCFLRNDYMQWPD